MLLHSDLGFFSFLCFSYYSIIDYISSAALYIPVTTLQLQFVHPNRLAFFGRPPVPFPSGNYRFVLCT